MHKICPLMDLFFFPRECFKVPWVCIVHLLVQGGPRGNHPFKQESEPKNALFCVQIEKRLELDLVRKKQREV